LIIAVFAHRGFKSPLLAPKSIVFSIVLAVVSVLTSAKTLRAHQFCHSQIYLGDFGASPNAANSLLLLYNNSVSKIRPMAQGLLFLWRFGEYRLWNEPTQISDC
jgi:hypothetical protein